MSTQPVLFDDIDAIDAPSEEVEGLIHHSRALAYLLAAGADSGQASLSHPEIYHLMLGLVHRASRVRYAIQRQDAQEQTAQERKKAA